MRSPAVVAHEVIPASAGSGKTYQLAHRYIRLLSHGVAPDRICALTFSRKAAGEIFDSIVHYLCDSADTAEAARGTAGQIGRPELERAAFRSMLRGFLNELHRIHVGTLDSFIVGIVRAFPSELGVSMEFQVVDGDGPAARELQYEVLARLFLPGGMEAPARREFLEAFKQATFGKEEKGFERNLDDFLGKFRRLYRLLPDGTRWGGHKAIWPDGSRWLAAPGDLGVAGAAARAWLDGSALPAKIVTALRRVVDIAAAYGPTSQWDPSLAGKVFSEVLAHIDALGKEDVSIEYSRKSYELPAVFGAALAPLLVNLVGTEIDRCLQQTAGLFRILDQYERLYLQGTRASGRLTFDDAQVLLTEHNPDSGGALISRVAGVEQRLYIDYRLDCQLDHWLFDEFQDTSDLQWSVFRNLIDEVVQDDSGRRSFFYVGDIKQAIYGWRGGNARLFDSVLKQYRGRIDESPMNRSFRSCKAVIDTVNAVFGELDAPELPAGAVSAWRDIWGDHSCALNVPANGYAAVVEPPIGDDGKKPDADARYRVVAALVREIAPVRRGLSTAVLVRTNDVGRAVVETLRRECPDVTVIHEGKTSILDSAAVALLLSVVRLGDHPGDEFAWQHLCMSPLRGVLGSGRRDRSALCLDLLQRLQSEGFRGVVSHWTEILAAHCELTPFDRARLGDLAAAAAEFDELGRCDCGGFVRFCEHYQVKEAAAGHAVRVMTIHQSKGLGFDVVILPDLMGRSLTSVRDVDVVLGGGNRDSRAEWALKMPRRIVSEQDDVLAGQLARENERHSFDALCVLYVALTRAKRALYMVTSFPGKKSQMLDSGGLIKERLVGDRKPEGGPPATVGGEEVVVLHEKGDANWFAEIGAEEGAAAVPPPALPAGFSKRPSRRQRLARVEPSRGEEIVGRASQFFDRESRDVMDFGSAIHGLFEQVEWIETADADAIVRDWQATATESADVRRDVEKQFRRALRAEAVRTALAEPEGDCELWREKRFEIVLSGDRWVSGIFDRVVIRRDDAGRALSATVIDYKSSRVDTEEQLGHKVEEYGAQMRLYAEALSRMFHLPGERITLKLIFTRTGQVGLVDGVVR